jgi:hypothetical protein
MSQLEESQRKMCTHLGLENPEPVVYPDLPTPTVADLWAWYRTPTMMVKMMMKPVMRSKRSLSEDVVFSCLFLVLDAKSGRSSIYLAIFMSLVCSSLGL